MAEGIVIKSERNTKDASKANPRFLEDYTVKFPKNYEKFNGRVTVRFRHITADIISRCFCEDGEGHRMLSDFRVFEKCVKEINGLTKIETNEDGIEEEVPFTVSEIVNFEDLRAEAEGMNAISIVFIVVHDVAQAILAKSALTEEEEKNLSADVKRS